MCIDCVNYVKITTTTGTIQTCSIVPLVAISINGEIIVKKCNKYKSEKS